jgi:hypothetical protein
VLAIEARWRDGRVVTFHNLSAEPAAVRLPDDLDERAQARTAEVHQVLGDADPMRAWPGPRTRRLRIPLAARTRLKALSQLPEQVQTAGRPPCRRLRLFDHWQARDQPDRVSPTAVIQPVLLALNGSVVGVLADNPSPDSGGRRCS